MRLKLQSKNYHISSSSINLLSNPFALSQMTIYNPSNILSNGTQNLSVGSAIK